MLKLERLPSAFFSVSLAAHGDMENARAYVEKFEQETGWRPTQVGLFGGALLYRQYGFLKRLMMKKIVSDKPGGLSTDTSRDHVYTDWDEVKRFAEAFLERLVLKTLRSTRPREWTVSTAVMANVRSSGSEACRFNGCDGKTYAEKARRLWSRSF